MHILFNPFKSKIELQFFFLSIIYLPIMVSITYAKFRRIFQIERGTCVPLGHEMIKQLPLSKVANNPLLSRSLKHNYPEVPRLFETIGRTIRRRRK